MTSQAYMILVLAFFIPFATIFVNKIIIEKSKYNKTQASRKWDSIVEELRNRK